MKASPARAKTRLVGDGRLLRNVMTMLSGTTLAQVITVAAMVPLARLYSPTDFGFFTIAQSLVTVGTAFAALRYDVAIVLPEREADARVLHRLASRLIAVVSTIMAVVLLLVSHLVNDHYQHETFGLWLAVAAVIVYSMAQIMNIQNWLIRRSNFGPIAQNKVLAPILMVTTQLIMAPLIGGFEGLLLGMLLGQILALAVLYGRTTSLREPIPADAPTMRNMANRYKKMPMLNAPNVIVDAIRDAGINVLIGNIAMGSLGQFSLANRATNAPVYLIRGAIAQVFLPMMARAEPGQLVPLLKKLLLRIGVISAPAFALFYWIAPTLFVVLFGPAWSEAGLFAQALVPWLFLNTFTSPLANVYITAEKQEWLLGFAVVYAAAPLTFLALSTLPLMVTVHVLAWIMSALLLCMVGMTMMIARRFDRGVTAPCPGGTSAGPEADT